MLSYVCRAIVVELQLRQAEVIAAIDEISIGMAAFRNMFVDSGDAFTFCRRE